MTSRTSNLGSILMCVLLALITSCAGQAVPLPHESVEVAADQALDILFRHFVGKEGLLHDYEGEIPTPEDCAKGTPNAIGWWSPIENGPMFTGVFLDAVCRRAEQTGSSADRELARKLAGGLMLSATVSDVPGMIVRGVGTDGRCHYPLGSEDQTIPWYFGLYAYWKSGIPTPAQRAEITRTIASVTSALEANEWKCPCDGAFKGQSRGQFMENELVFRGAAHSLFLLRAAYEMTGNEHWLEEYGKMCHHRQTSTELTMLEVCAEGLALDLPKYPTADGMGMWIYVCAQGCLSRLAEMDPENASFFRSGLARNAAQVAEKMEAFSGYDNHKEIPFKYANWKTGYRWTEQKTQADAEQVAYSGDKAILGDRKNYERSTMTMPLAAAALCAFSGGYEDMVSRIVCAYDYSQINICEFFLAVVAAYAPGITPP